MSTIKSLSSRTVSCPCNFINKILNNLCSESQCNCIAKSLLFQTVKIPSSCQSKSIVRHVIIAMVSITSGSVLSCVQI
jgi:hypothetical protein